MQFLYIFLNNFCKILFVFCVSKAFLKKFKNFFIFLLQIDIFLAFSNYFNALISKIIFKK